MAEYIEREAAIRALLNDCMGQVSYSREDAADCIFFMDTADVVPVRHGRWEYIPQTLNTLSQLRCPFCGWWSLDPSIDGTYNYCPNCGAKMDGKRRGEAYES